MGGGCEAKPRANCETVKKFGKDIRPGNIHKRLDNLEDAAKPDRGLVVLYASLVGDGYWDQQPYSKDKLKITEAKKRELELRHDVIVVKYVEDWPPGAT